MYSRSISLEKNKNHVNYGRRGFAHFQMNNYEDSIKDLTTALKLNSQ